MRCRKTILHGAALCVMLGMAGSAWSLPDQPRQDTGGVEEIQRQLGLGFADPERFIRSGSCRILVEYLSSHRGSADTSATTSMLENLLAQARTRADYPMIVVGDIALFASVRGKTGSCCGLLEGAGISTRRLFNPDLGLSMVNLAAEEGCPEASDTMAQLSSYVQNDLPIARLLSQPPPVQDLRAYIKKGEETYGRCPHSLLKADLSRRIGDAYLSMNDLSGMARWYRRAIAADPSLEKNTVIGFRLHNYRIAKVKSDGITAGMAGLCLVLLLLVIRAIKNRGRFDGKFFLTRLSAALLVYGALTWIVCAVDARFASKMLLHLTNEQTTAMSIVGPIIPLNALDITCFKTAAWILASGFLPILFAVFFVSFKRSYSRWLLAAIILLSASSLWMHFYFTRIYSVANSPKGYVMHGRVYLRDEPEELLVKHPDKALAANPDLLKSDNDDLHEFLEKHFPTGFPGKPH